MKKDVFVDKHEQLDVIDDRRQFLTLMKEIWPYLVEFKKDDIMKDKNYFSNYAIKDEDCRLVIIIIHDECIFSANNSIQKA